MAAKKGSAPATTGSLDISSLFEQELQARNEDLRRQAALTMFYKLHPNNKVNVEQFIAGIKQHKDVWSVVSTMGVVDFAEAILGGKVRAPAQAPAGKPARRTRLNENQKTNLKQVIQKTLSDSKDGLNRNEIAKNVSNEQLSNIGVSRDELANKLRQPLSELVSDGKIHTVGEKRLMKYLVGSGSRKKG
jgi:hypothetical protein